MKFNNPKLRAAIFLIHLALAGLAAGFSLERMFFFLGFPWSSLIAIFSMPLGHAFGTRALDIGLIVCVGVNSLLLLGWTSCLVFREKGSGH